MNLCIISSTGRIHASIGGPEEMRVPSLALKIRQAFPQICVPECRRIHPFIDLINAGEVKSLSPPRFPMADRANPDSLGCAAILTHRITGANQKIARHEFGWNRPDPGKGAVLGTEIRSREETDSAGFG